LRDGHGHHDLLGTDHYFFSGAWAVFLKIFLHSKNCWKKNRARRALGKKIDQVLFTYQVLCLTKKKFLLKLLPTKKCHAQPKGEKKFLSQKIAQPHLKKIMVRPLMFTL